MSVSSAAAPAASSAAPTYESPYVPAPHNPTQTGLDGVLFDFNSGLRVILPTTGSKYRVRFWDEDTKTLLYEAIQEPKTYALSLKKYFIRFRLRVDEVGTGRVLVNHTFDARDRVVVIQMAVGTLGDTIGWLSYIERFQQTHGCRLVVSISDKFIDLFRKQYPTITMVTKEQLPLHYKDAYATYYLGLFFGGDTQYQPRDFRYVGLHRTAGYILGLQDLSDIPPRLDLSAPRKIQEPYVCIATQSTSQAKYWNHPEGWLKTIKFLKSLGYRVLCIDRNPVVYNGVFANAIPHGCEDFTGELPLQQRVDLLKDADAFIGLSSGLSWLAWSAGTPVVMISGFTAPENEFYTPYRVFNPHSCHSCWNDMRNNFDHRDYFWCPAHKGTPRQFECTRTIPPEHVIEVLKRVPAISAVMRKAPAVL